VLDDEQRNGISLNATLIDFDYASSPQLRFSRWKAKGWAIAMHGYSHASVPIAGQPIFPVSGRNEFTGLPYEEQGRRIRESLRLFREQELNPAAWIAPGHCFDRTTLRVLRDETEIAIVSD
jgi:predicted deacetylase